MKIYPTSALNPCQNRIKLNVNELIEQFKRYIRGIAQSKTHNLKEHHFITAVSIFLFQKNIKTKFKIK